MKLRFTLIKVLYIYFFKKIFFLFDPENVHDQILKYGKFLGSYSATKFIAKFLFSYEHKMLENSVDGIFYKNPIGLAAGFDKNAELMSILPSVGFGYEEIGSITAEYCPGNERPRLWRVPELQSLVVYYGLKNDGSDSIANVLQNKKFNFPIGVSIAKTNSADTVDTQAGIADYKKTLGTFVEKNIGDYFTINISCPNSFGGEPFTDPYKLDLLLSELQTISHKKPVYLKLPAELPFVVVDEIVSISKKYHINGFICTNLSKKTEHREVNKNIPQVGGFSGKAVHDSSNELISYLYKKYGNDFTIIGCGGIFTAQDAYEKIKRGASLLQLITGMIYQGPQTIGEINHGITRLLQKDGYTSINQAVGSFENK